MAFSKEDILEEFTAAGQMPAVPVSSGTSALTCLVPEGARGGGVTRPHRTTAESADKATPADKLVSTFINATDAGRAEIVSSLPKIDPTVRGAERKRPGRRLPPGADGYVQRAREGVDPIVLAAEAGVTRATIWRWVRNAERRPIVALRTDGERRELVAKYLTTDQKACDFCAIEGVSMSTLQTWRKKFAIADRKARATSAVTLVVTP